MIFLTGFPGFIATRLIRRLIEKNPGETFACLVEPRMHALAEKVAGEIEQSSPPPQPSPLKGEGVRIEIIDGDITRPDLGLSRFQMDRMVLEVDKVFHLAAIYDLTVPAAL